MLEYIGQQIGNYRITRFLGHGGFASVYLGEHLYLKTQAAIKLLRVQVSSQELQSFLREAQTIAQLEHPHIIRVLDFGIDSSSSQPFFVMEYAMGGSLRCIHPRGSILPLRTVVSYIREIASALHYAHQKKIVHCDVKPENMLLTSTSKIVLSDFGIAITAHTTESISKQNFAGTAFYMAPEQIQGKARPASDQYALAVVAYEWLCGVCPFDGPTSFAIMMSHLTDTPTPLRARVSSISQEVENVVLKALDKNPHQRFTDINEFALALEDAQHSTRNRIKRTSFVPYVTLTSPSPLPVPEDNNIVQPPQQIVVPTIKVAPTPSPATPKPAISRRTVIAGAITLATLGIGGITWSLVEHSYAQSSTPDTKLMLGTTILVYTGHASGIYTLGWSSNSKVIASGSGDGEIQLWDSTTRKKFLTYKGHMPLPSANIPPHQGSFVESLAWSPDGQWIASGGKEAMMNVWNTTTGSKLYTYYHEDLIGTIAWSHDGLSIASGGWKRWIHICDAATGKKQHLLKGHQNDLSSIDWSPNDVLLISASDDQTVRVWDASNGELLYIYRGHTSAVKQAKWSPDGTKIASGGDDKVVHVWDYENRNTLFTYYKHTGGIRSIAWSPDGTKIASASDDHTVQIWDSKSGETITTYRGHSQTTSVTVAAWSPDGTKIASGSYDQTVRVWKAI